MNTATRTIHPGNAETFITEFEKQLRANIDRLPARYAYGLANVPAVIARFRTSLDRGTYDHNGATMKNTCEALGIKHTRTAIEEFIRL